MYHMITKILYERLSKRMYVTTRIVKFLYQRLTRGWDDSETWSLDHSLAKLILPRLKRFKELNCVHPCDLTYEEWNIILDKMIYSFEYLASESRWTGSYNKNHDDIINEGTELFGKYIQALWW